MFMSRRDAVDVVRFLPQDPKWYSQKHSAVKEVYEYSTCNIVTSCNKVSLVFFQLYVDIISGNINSGKVVPGDVNSQNWRCQV